MIDGRWFVSVSNGMKFGDFWVGGGVNWICYVGVFLVGFEDFVVI